MVGPFAARFSLSHHATLSAPNDGATVASFDIGPAGEAVVLWSVGDRIVATVHGSDRDPVELGGAVPEWPMAQPLPGGRLLVVGARSEWQDVAGEHNAFVFGSDGSLEQTACLGDGIEHVQVADDGSIWVGYFDEGVYGNFGWGMDGGPEPIGAPGIVQFTPSLEVTWEFPNSDSPIDDCYALNVDGNDVWACYYSDFDIVRIRSGEVQHWSNEIEGAKAMAVGDIAVALLGGYAEGRDRLAFGRPGDDAWTTGRLTMPNGRRLPQDARVAGRGAELHALVDSDWFTWSLADHT